MIGKKKDVEIKEHKHEKQKLEEAAKEQHRIEQEQTEKNKIEAERRECEWREKCQKLDEPAIKEVKKNEVIENSNTTERKEHKLKEPVEKIENVKQESTEIERIDFDKRNCEDHRTRRFSDFNWNLGIDTEFDEINTTVKEKEIPDLLQNTDNKSEIICNEIDTMLQSTRESLDIRKVRRPLPPVPNVSPIKLTHINKPVVGTLLIKTGISSTPKKPTVSAPLTTVIVTIPKPDPVGFISKPLPCASTTPIISKISEIPKQLGTDVTPKVIKDVPKIQIKETPKKNC